MISQVQVFSKIFVLILYPKCLAQQPGNEFGFGGRSLQCHTGGRIDAEQREQLGYDSSIGNVQAELPVGFTEGLCYTPADQRRYCVKAEGVFGAGGAVRFCPQSVPSIRPGSSPNQAVVFRPGQPQSLGQSTLFSMDLCIGRRDGECYRLESHRTRFVYQICCCFENSLCNGATVGEKEPIWVTIILSVFVFWFIL